MLLGTRRAFGEAASASRVTIAVALIAVACSGDSTMAPGPQDQAQAARTPGSTGLNVTSTFFDRDGAGNLLLTRSDDQTGAGYASYSASGSNKITSQIMSTRPWQLYLGGQTARQLYLALSSIGIPNLADGYYSANVEAFSQCFAADNTTFVTLLSMSAATSNGNCSFGVDFSVGKTKYKLVMSPRYAGTGRALVTCTAASATACTSWTIEPDTNAANAGVANLYHYANNGSLILDGVYRNSYLVSVSQ